jgi:hypothetical protein
MANKKYNILERIPGTIIQGDECDVQEYLL